MYLKHFWECITVSRAVFETNYFKSKVQEEDKQNKRTTTTATDRKWKSKNNKRFQSDTARRKTKTPTLGEGI